MSSGTSTRAYAYNNLAGCVLQKTQEVTGAPVGLYHAGQAGIDAGDHLWVTVCERHATIATHRTQKQAREALDLIEWCEACQSTDTMRFARVIFRLRHAAYQAQFLVGKDRTHGLHLAKHWSGIGRAGVFFIPGDQADCFDQAGNLVKPIPCYWEGDQHLIIGALEDAGLHATISSLGEQRTSFSTLLIQPDGGQSEKEEYQCR